MMQQKTLPPEPNSDGKIAVSLWLARDPRIVMAGAAAREVA
jgi:demethylmenaquinone methyltransferase/2-methoxy-6-polyprenyl-1,4-benzoquinol methylase/ArsR family transcriptional regulator